MNVLHASAFDFLMGTDLSKYTAILTLSPFNTVNRVMLDLKKHRPNVPWIAQFSDPWARNPLENKRLQLWNAYFEPKAVEVMDAIVHSSPYSRDLMFKGSSKKHQSKASVIPHFFLDELYPKRPKKKNDLITLRFLGTLFGKRSPQIFFTALNDLLSRRKDFADQISVELIGLLPRNIQNMSDFASLPEGLIKIKNSVSYLESLELMYDADILLLIEAAVKQNLFFPSKLIDYLGANTRIVGMVPPGASKDVCEMLKAWYASPTDIEGIARALEAAIDDVRLTPSFAGYEAAVRNQFSVAKAGELYGEILKKYA
jgi:glycosyltransferase involved in cell wall biosynthesis